MTIDDLKAIAAHQYNIRLHPIAVLKSHCLEYDGSIKGRYKDGALTTMTEAQFKELCETAVKPPVANPIDYQQLLIDQAVQKRQRHSPTTGHWRY
jgi:hypothetical protein